MLTARIWYCVIIKFVEHSHKSLMRPDQTGQTSYQSLLLACGTSVLSGDISSTGQYLPRNRHIFISGTRAEVIAGNVAPRRQLRDEAVSEGLTSTRCNPRRRSRSWLARSREQWNFAEWPSPGLRAISRLFEASEGDGDYWLRFTGPLNRPRRVLPWSQCVA